MFSFTNYTTKTHTCQGKSDNITPTKHICRGGFPLPFFSLLPPRHRRFCRGEHVFDKDSVAHAGIVDHHVGDRADELTVLDDWATRHECGQEGTTLFNGKFTKGTTFFERFALVIRFAFNYS